MVSSRDSQTIRALAARWMEFTASPVMDQHKRLWKWVDMTKSIFQW